MSTSIFAPLARILTVLIIGCSTFALRADSLQVPDYSPGEVVQEDVSTPIRLVIIDQAATDALRIKEAQRVPAIYRFQPRAIDEVEASFRSTFDTTRSNFMVALQKTFKKPSLTAALVTRTNFQKFRNTFQRQNKSFPLTADLAELWAQDESDIVIQTELLIKLRSMMSQRIRPDVLPPEGRIGPLAVKLIAISNATDIVTAEIADATKPSFIKTNFITLTKARVEIQKDIKNKATGKFLASFLKPNCFVEAELTAQARAKRTEALFAADNYEAGALIVKKGDVLDVKKKAALDQLKSKTAVDQLKVQISDDRSKAQAAINQLKSQTAVVESQVNQVRTANQRRYYWFSGGGAALFLLISIRLLFRRKPAASLLPVPAQSVVLEAEPVMDARQDPNRAALQSGLLAFLKNTFTRKLLAQRQTLIDAQEDALLEINAMEQRLKQIKAPIEDRLNAYQRRIEELEKELAIKGEQNRELIKAKILMTRKQLELERTRNHLEWN